MKSWLVVVLVVFGVSGGVANAQDPKAGPRGAEEGVAKAHAARIRELMEVETAVTPGYVVPFAIQLGPELKRAEEAQQKRFLKLYDHALDLVKREPPVNQPTLFQWDRNREILEGKDLVVVLTTSTDPFASIFLGGVNGSPTMDSFTIAAGSKRSTRIVTCLLIDRLIFDNTKVREDWFSRMAVAIAHAFYGDVYNTLSIDPTSRLRATPKQLQDEKIRSYRATLDFLQRIRDSKLWSDPGIDVGKASRLKKEFEALQKREEALLRVEQAQPLR